MRVRGLLTVALAMSVAQLAAVANAATTDSSRPAGSQRTQAKSLPDGSYRVAQACGYWAIFGCSTNYGAAQGTVNRYGGGCVKNTDDCDNFAGGYYCAVSGPKTQQAAQITANRMRQSGVSSQAYIKYACCPSAC